jgi:hypothetical protein
MASLARLKIDLSVEGSAGEGILQSFAKEYRFVPGAAADTGGTRITVSIAAATFGSITVPTSAKLVMIFLPADAESLYLKSLTGDSTGIALTPASAVAGLPVILPLGASPTLGILNSGDATINFVCVFY